MKLGFLLPVGEIGDTAEPLRDFVRQAEAIGYDFVEAPDHVLEEHDDPLHDPFTVLGFLAGATSRIEFSTGVLVLPQRQTALVAKQAASLDILSGGRFRLGVGVGWNELEFIGLGEDFGNRGIRSEEQFEVLRRLWAEHRVDFVGRWHRIPGAGINPRPPAGTIPLWIGGGHENTLRRIARFGDGWIMNTYPPDHTATDVFDRLYNMVAAQGRARSDVGIEAWTSMGGRGASDWRSEFAFWKRAGVSHLCLTTAFDWMHHQRIDGRGFDDHLSALRTYFDAVQADADQ